MSRKRKPESDLTPTPIKKSRLDESGRSEGKFESKSESKELVSFFDQNSCVFRPIISVQRATDLKWIDKFLFNGREITAGDENYLMKLAPHSVLKIEDQAREYLLKLTNNDNALNFCEFWYPVTDVDAKHTKVTIRASYVQKACSKTIESNKIKPHEFFDVRVTPFFGTSLLAWAKKNINRTSDLDISKIVLSCVEAIAFLSDRHVFQGDLNSGNILIGPDQNEKAKIIDFGRSIIYNKVVPDDWAFATPSRSDQKEWQAHRIQDLLFEFRESNYFPPECYIPFYTRKQIETIFESDQKWIDRIKPQGDFGWQRFYGYSKHYVAQTNMYSLVVTLFLTLGIDQDPRIKSNRPLFDLLRPYLEYNPASRPKIHDTIQQLNDLIKDLELKSRDLKSRAPSLSGMKLLEPKKTDEKPEKESKKEEITPTPQAPRVKKQDVIDLTNSESDVDDEFSAGAWDLGDNSDNNVGDLGDFGPIPDTANLEDFVPGID